MRFIMLVFPIMLLTACAEDVVHTDFIPGTDFSHIRTYAWIKKPTTQNPLMDERMVNDIDLQLAQHGWKNVDSHESADAALSATVATKDQERIDTMSNGMGYGYGPGWGWGGWGGGMGMGGMSTSTVYHVTIGTLIVDIFDTKTKNAIWEGTASGTISDNPSTNVKNTRDAIVEMFKGFPPGSVSSSK
ncbi:DUF4136 domain-containing protein [Candidatus Methylospira mobilis]|uniref:DUF4136 domain-containing protein n=1 Tax=Candidatus Methylospira mobilis TaxID=1808979 RepID=A0A5Q0BL45_9GAMM|nr:DUF4136 domain-containing protein [Candidatus Methylospira mobilis]QFY44665.1 DUF4136 domain-containing protein [Candidatus Methylospira mobilis]WNV05798.1 DUF4136 domain-containing protein [Candidatus Methylospira mobilis]